MATDSENDHQNSEPENENPDSDNDKEEDLKRKKKKEKQKQRLLKEIAKAQKRGVCYLSRIPPHLKPLKLRHLLSHYGEVLRIYLSPEDPAIRQRRKMAGKNTGKNFTEGWIEFADKKVAKRVAKMLNGEPMGGKRRSAYFYDLWNIKYLKKFKWDNLTEEIAYRNAVREQKQAADISAAKRERDFYLEKVDQSKAIRAMEERKAKKQRTDGENNDEAPSTEQIKVVRHVSQKKPVAANGTANAPKLSKDILSAVLGKR